MPKSRRESDKSIIGEAQSKIDFKQPPNRTETISSPQQSRSKFVSQQISEIEQEEMDVPDDL